MAEGDEREKLEQTVVRTLSRFGDRRSGERIKRGEVVHSERANWKFEIFGCMAPVFNGSSSAPACVYWSRRIDGYGRHHCILTDR